MTGMYSTWSTWALLITIFGIPLCLWLVRKYSMSSGKSGSLRLVEWLSIGPKDRLVIVHTGNEYLLLGSTAQGLTLIRKLPNYVESGQQSKPFGTVLADVVKNA